MINGETVRRKLELSSNRIGQRLSSGAGDSDLLSEVYLTAVGREPTAVERSRGRLASSQRERSPVLGGKTSCAAQFNSKEFLSYGTDGRVLFRWQVVREVR